jgi:two-component system response regulator AtoC
MSRGAVLIAEDDARARETLRALLAEEGYCTDTAAGGDEAWHKARSGTYDALLLDIRMPGRDGLAILRDLPKSSAAPIVLVMTAFGSSAVAIEAMKLGAYDYLTKPLHFDELLIQLERALSSRRRAQQLQAWRGDPEPQDDSLVGDSSAMQQVYKLIGQVAAADSTVLIHGESGTGKELVARAIHAHSPRHEWPIVAVNCAAIPEALLESELFGYEKGAFTGADSRRRGKFESAGRGTVFLDEVAEMAPSTQAKLLRVLQQRTIERLGSEELIRLDVRIIAATNRNLEQCVRDGSFREDLYYRLNVVTIAVPPLRDRREDIPVLARYFAARVSRRNQLPFPGFTDEALEELCKREWPGNVRELEHAIERALVLSRGGPVTAEAFAPPKAGTSAGWATTAPMDSGMHSLVAQLERSLIERALAQAAGNRTRAAEILKIHRRLLYDKLREFGME